MAKKFEIKTVFSVIDNLTRPVKNMERQMSRLDRTSRTFNKLNAVSNRFTSSLTRMGVVGLATVTAAAYATTRALGGLASVGMELETTEAGFKSMVGGAEKARQLMIKLKDAAAQTPFELKGLAKVAASTLPIMNGDIEKTVSTMRRLADVSRGSQDILERVTKGYIKAGLKRKVDMESLTIMVEAGVTIYDELFEVVGVKSRAAFEKMMRAGKISFSALEKALVRVTGKGGMFYKGAANLMDTVQGKLSTLYTVLGWAVKTIWEGISTPLKTLIDKAIELTAQFQAWLMINKEIIQGRLVDYIKKASTALDNFAGYIKALNKEKPILDRITDTLDKIGSTIAFVWENRKAITALVVGLYAVNTVLGLVAGVLAVITVLSWASGRGLVAAGISALIVGLTVLYFRFESWGQTVKDVLYGIGWFLYHGLIHPFMVFFDLLGLIEYKNPFENLESDKAAKNIDRTTAAMKRLDKAKVGDKWSGLSKRMMLGAKNTTGDSWGGLQLSGALSGGYAAQASQYVSSPETRSIEERKVTEQQKVTINIQDKTGKAEIDKENSSYQGLDLNLLRSGGFQ